MNIITHPQTVSTSPRLETKTRAEALIDAAGRITSLLEQVEILGTADLRQIMTESFGGSDAEGLWLWKGAYEATEAAQVLFLREFGSVMVARDHAPQSTLAMPTKVANLVPTADSMTVTERRLTNTHPVTGAQSHLLTIKRGDRNAPMQLEDVQGFVQQDPRAKLMINDKSRRPAVMIPTCSIMLDGGSIQARVSLIRPMDELRLGVRQIEETSWEETDKKAFAQAWDAEVAAVPEFSTSTMHIVGGLLLPIWKLLPQDFWRCRNFRIDQTKLTAPDQAWPLLVDGSSIVGLTGDMTLRRVRVMNEYRVELTGFTDGMRDWLRTIGLFSEGSAILSKLIQRHRLIDVACQS